MPGHIKSQHRHLGDGMVVVPPSSRGYSLYIVSFLIHPSLYATFSGFDCATEHSVANYVSLMPTRAAFVIVAGVILSICAALPWTPQSPGLCDDGVPY
ncbi:hypothetical protein BD769DRAFT_1665974 [Suillus cothurnatus]|nr:hypothetical protein BD769DRAFT_1665974 [Suillus cothurnatus]